MSFPRYTNYRDSGIEWLGDVPAHWEVRPLRQLGRLLKGSGGSKEDVVESGVPCVRYGDLYTTHGVFIHDARTRVTPARAEDYTPMRYGDVLFAGSGETFEEIGKSAVNLIDRPAVCGGDLIILRPTAAVHPPFLGYACDSDVAAKQKAMMGRGTTVKHIYPDELRSLALSVPPFAEQFSIATFLGRETAKIDALVAEQRRLIDLLKEKRQAVISHAVTKGLNPHAPMKVSGIEWLGEIPRHWRVSALKHLAKAGGKTFTDGDWIESPFITSDGVRLIQTGNVGVGIYKEQGHRFVSNRTFAELQCTEVNPRDVLICRLDGPVGRACLAPALGVRMITSVDNTIMKVADDVVPEFVVDLLSSVPWLSWIDALCRVGGGFRLRVSRSMLGDLRVPVPPPSEQLAIARHLDSETAKWDALTVEAERAIELLQERRTALISAAVTGQIDVRGMASPEAA